MVERIRILCTVYDPETGAYRYDVKLIFEIAGGLTERECQQLIGAIEDVHASGVTIVWIEHVVHALLAVAVPFIEVHLSNVNAREPFRRHSYFSDIAAGSIVGLGAQGYELALQAALDRLDATTGEK